MWRFGTGAGSLVVTGSSPFLQVPLQAVGDVGALMGLQLKMVGQGYNAFFFKTKS